MKWAHPLKGLTVKERLAEALGVPDEYDRFCTNQPHEIKWGGYVSWEGPLLPGQCHHHFHSWDNMRDCLKYGFDVTGEGEVVARDNDWNRKGKAGA